MKIRQTVARWHGGQLVIACIVMLLVAGALVAVDFYLFDSISKRESAALEVYDAGLPQDDPLRSSDYSVALRAQHSTAEDRQREDYEYWDTLVTKGGLTGVRADEEVQRRRQRFDASRSMRNEISGRYERWREVPRTLLLLVPLATVTAILTMCWMWLGARVSVRDGQGGAA